MHPPERIQEGGGNVASGVETLIQRFSNYLAAYQKSPRTQAEYTKVIRAWAAWWRRPIEDFGTDAWDEWAFYLTETRGLSGVSIRAYQSALRKFYKFLRRKKLVHHNPSEDHESVGIIKRLPEFLSEEQVNAMFDACSTPMETALLELLYSCGLRNSEVRDLPLENITQSYVRVMGKGKRERLVDLMPRSWTALKAYVDGRHGWFYALGQKKGTRVAMMTVQRVVRRLAKSAGITKRVHPHMLRHSIATHLLARGCDLAYIQEFLGHTSIETTRIYAHIAHEQTSRAVLAAHPRA